MSEHVVKTIELLQSQIQEEERKTDEKRKIVNSLCPLAGLPIAYPGVNDPQAGVTLSTQRDEFYGKPLAKVVRTIMLKRKAANLGAATVQEIYEAMKAGGYHFQAKNDDNAKRSLYINLTKNTASFHKLPNGTYGLTEWYPAVRAARQKPEAASVAVEEATVGDEGLVDDDEQILKPDWTEAAEELAEAEGGAPRKAK